jgi:hypothetical protein
MTVSVEDGNWRPVTEHVSKAMNPTRLAILLAQLHNTLDEWELLQQTQTESDWVFIWDAPLVFFN